MTTTPQSMSDWRLCKDDQEQAIWQAIQNIRIGNKTDDKLIVSELRALGFVVCRATAEQAGKVEGRERELVANWLHERAEMASARRGHNPHNEGIIATLDRCARELEARLLAKPTQPAASIPEFVPPICRDAACAAAGTQHDYCTPKLPAATQMPVAWMWEEKDYFHLWANKAGFTVPEYEEQDKWIRNAQPLYAAPVSPSREVEALVTVEQQIALARMFAPWFMASLGDLTADYQAMTLEDIEGALRANGEYAIPIIRAVQENAP